MDEFDDLWLDREEFLLVVEKNDPFCTCEDYGEDSCPIHSQLDLDVIEDQDVEKLTITYEDGKNKKANNKRKKTTQR